MGVPVLVRQLITLAKPRVISLLVVTGVCGVWKASEGSPDPWVMLAVAGCGGLAAAGSNAINQGFDADIDAVMRRTRNRPVPLHRVRPALAIAVGVAWVAAAVVLLGLLTNWAAGLLTLAAAAIYVFVYTLLLKRRSWNNIVIGGAAGAFPPLIGAAAVSGGVDAVGLYMFAFVFFWTPPHFWTLSLLLRDDYAAVGVPMLGSVASERATAVQVALYIGLLIALSWLPLAAGYGGVFFGAVSTAMGLLWLRRTRPLLRGGASYRQTLGAYKYSLLHLAVVFMALGLETHLPWA
jgi:protoheme IX farnesyltransferase